MTKRPTWTCNIPNCGKLFFAEKARDRHQAKDHQKCPNCGKMFTSLKKHLSQLRRAGKSCPIYLGTAGTLTVH